MRALGYPLKMEDRIPDITKARNIELGLGLQVVLLLPIILLFLFLLKTTYCYHLLIVAFVVVSRKVRKENYVNSRGQHNWVGIISHELDVISLNLPLSLFLGSKFTY